MGFLAEEESCQVQTSHTLTDFHWQGTAMRAPSASAARVDGTAPASQRYQKRVSSSFPVSTEVGNPVRAEGPVAWAHRAGCTVSQSRLVLPDRVHVRGPEGCVCLLPVTPGPRTCTRSREATLGHRAAGTRRLWDTLQLAPLRPSQGNPSPDDRPGAAGRECDSTKCRQQSGLCSRAQAPCDWHE